MNKILLLVFIVTFPIIALAQELNCSHACKEFHEYEFSQDLKRSRYYRQTEDYDLKYHRLEWFVDPDTFYIQGAITSYFEVKTNSFSKIYFDLANSLIVDSVIYKVAKLNYKFSNENLLEIEMGTNLSKGDFDSITIFYHGNPSNQGFGSFVKDYHGSSSIIWTLSEPYGALDWWPCKQSLNDKIDSVDIYVKTLKGYKAASNGLLVSSKIEGNFVTYYWKHRYPIPAYLIAISVTNYSEYTDYAYFENDSFPVLNYIYPEDSALYRKDAMKTVDMIDFLQSKFGEYPFSNEKYGHAQFGRGGGMEHQTMSFVSGLSEYLVLHELAHQWFGDKVTCQSWSDIWLNEGFATYSEGLWRESIFPYHGFNEWKRDRIAEIIKSPNGSVYITGVDTLSVSRVFSYRFSYLKGGMVLHMLRKLVGDEIFFQAIKNYLNDPSLAYSYAQTNDLIKHFELLTESDLDGFFNDWIFGHGYPSYQLTWARFGDKVKFNVYQSQSDPSVDFFEMNIPIGLYGERDTIVYLKNLYNDQSFILQIPFEFDSIAFDPNYDLISGNNSIIQNKIDIKEGYKFWIYPNPLINDQLNLFVLGNLIINSIEIIDNAGKIIYSENIGLSNSNKFQYEIDLKGLGLRNGVYTIILKTNFGSYSDKFVKL